MLVYVGRWLLSLQRFVCGLWWSSAIYNWHGRWIQRQAACVRQSLMDIQRQTEWLRLAVTPIRPVSVVDHVCSVLSLMQFSLSPQDCNAIFRWKGKAEMTKCQHLWPTNYVNTWRSVWNGNWKWNWWGRTVVEIRLLLINIAVYRPGLQDYASAVLHWERAKLFWCWWLWKLLAKTKSSIRKCLQWLVWFVSLHLLIVYRPLQS